MAFSLKSLPTYYNGVTSFLSALVTFMTAVQGNEIITHEAPSNWVYGIGVGISAVTGVLSHLKQAQPTVDATSGVASVLIDIENVLNSFRPVTPANPVVPAQKPIVIPASPAQPATEVVSAVESAVSQAATVAEQTGKTVTDVVDEVAKVIQTYQKKLK